MIFHIQERAGHDRNWRGERYGYELLADNPFIHCRTENQIDEILTKFYSGAGEVIIMKIDESRLTSEVRYEGKRELYPHIYGEINRGAIVETTV
jgi:uncharacterized protein (DUF952 family)